MIIDGHIIIIIIIITIVNPAQHPLESVVVFLIICFHLVLSRAG